MKEHKYCVRFSVKSFENARRFRDAVESGDYSHDYGRYMTDLQGSIGWVVDRCLAISTEADDCVRMSMPGMVLLEYWTQAYCLVQDPSNARHWHCCWVDEEFGISPSEEVC